MRKIFENPNFINTSEATSDFISLGNSCVIIPYYNLALMSYNPINQKASFVSHAFYIFNEVQKILVRSENSHFEIQISDQKKEVRKDHLIIGGFRQGMKGAEIEIYYDSSALYIPSESEITSTQFDNFDNFDNLPNELIAKVGYNYYKIII